MLALEEHVADPRRLQASWWGLYGTIVIGGVTVSVCVLRSHGKHD